MNISVCRSGRKPALLSAVLASLLGVCGMFTPSAQAQTVKFAGAQTTLLPGLGAVTGVTVDPSGNIYYSDNLTNFVNEESPVVGGYFKSTIVGSTLNGPAQLAVDNAGNVYVADFNNNRVLKEVPSPGGYIQTHVLSITFPRGVAVDGSGNVYIAAGTSDSIVKETKSGAGYIKSLIGSGMNDPHAVAIDSSGNLYVVDTQNNRVLKETLSNGVYTQKTIGSGFVFPNAIAVDGAGVVYISDVGHTRLVKETPSGSSYVQTVVPTATPLIDPSINEGDVTSLAVDRYGNLLIAEADYDSGKILKLFPTGADFGQFNVGATSPAVSLMFNFTLGGTIGSLATLTQGVSGMDFANAGTGSCVAGGFFFTGGTCTLDVTFTPRYAGDRTGAVMFRDSNTQTIAAVNLHGAGYGAQATYLPPYERAIPSAANGVSSPFGVAVDGSGVVYIADSNNNRVLRESPSGRSFIESTLGLGLSSPSALALDGGSNLFIADSGNSRVVKLTHNGNGSWSQSTVGSGMLNPYGLAVGPDGAVYVSDTSNSRVLKETPSGSGYVQTTVPTVGLGHPYGIAVDGSSNIYVSDFTHQTLLKLTLANGKYTQSTIASSLAGVYGVAVDSMRNVFAALFSSSDILKYTPSGASYTPGFLSITGIQSPFGLTFDAGGNAYIADVGKKQVTEGIYSSAPSLGFADTPVNSTSTDSYKIVTLVNFGNLPLNVPVPASGHNPSISTNFTLDPSPFDACPILNAGGATPGKLNSGQLCRFYVSFTPVTTGAISGSLTLTDDALNPLHPGASHQTVPLSGNGMKIVTSINWTNPQAITYGTPLGATQLNATATDPGSNPVAGSFIYTPLAGTVLPAGSQPLSVSFTPTDATDYSKASGNVMLTVNKAVLTVTAKPASKTYGAANPAFSYTITGFVNGDTAATAVTGSPALTTTATASSPVGSYPIQAAIGTLASANYSFKFVKSTLTVNQASLTITATDVSLLYKTPLPAPAWTATGFVNGDTTAVLSGAPTETTTAANGSLPGSYPITISAGTLTASNYSLTFVNGTLTITSLGTEPAPTFTPAPGTFTGSVDVTINDTSANAVIHYTTDGTTPVFASPTYSAPIHLTTTTTLKAAALGPLGWVKSTVIVGVYTIQ